MIATVAQDNGSNTKTTLEALTEVVSASRLKRWSTCRLQFFYHYVLQIKKPSTVPLVVGKVVHSILQEWNKYRWRSDPTFCEKLNAIFDAKWIEESQQGTEWDGEEEQEKLKTLGLIEFYLANTPIKPDEKPMAVEVMLEADLSQHGLPKLIGVIDLVRPTGQIVDFKTSASTPNADNVAHLNEIQLTAYSILFRENTGDKESGIELHTLVKTKTPKLVVTAIDPITDNQQTRLFKQIESYVLGIQNEDYVPMPGMACLSCQFMKECKNWS